ncbi:MAG: hypothetical protein AB7G93_06645 [Bdellovibrionales bacterium]
MSRLKALLFAGLVGATQPSQAFNTYECLRALMPITERGLFQSKRKGFEEPVVLSDEYIAFPEIAPDVNKERVTGFFVYSRDGAWYYDAAELNTRRQPVKIPIADLGFVPSRGYYEMVAQPRGLETITIRYLPGFAPENTDSSGSTFLGTSMFPVIGALISRPEQRKTIYHNPGLASDSSLKKWIFDQLRGRRPASASQVVVNRTIVHLRTQNAKPRERLLEPLQVEHQLRRGWVQNNNLDEAAFRQLSAAMETHCRAR